jgi:hypothetical protein
VPVLGVGSIPQDGVSEIYMVIRAISPSASGCIDDYDPDQGDPGACALSFDAGVDASVTDITQVGVSGDVSITNESSGTVSVTATVFGYYQGSDPPTPGDTYVPLSQESMVDTRVGLGAPEARIPGGGSLTVQVTGEGGIPSDAVGAALSIGAANASATGTVSAYPAGGASNSAALLNCTPGQVVHGLYLGGVSSSGQLTLVNNGADPVDMMVGSEGYLVSPTASEAGSAYVAVDQMRVADTGLGVGVAETPVPAEGSISFAVEGVDGVPASGVAAAVGGNIWRDQNASNTVWRTDGEAAVLNYLNDGGVTPYRTQFGFTNLCLTSDHGITYGFGANIAGIGIQTETDHTTSVEQCVEANASDGLTNENRTDVVSGDYDNYYYFWGRSLTIPMRFTQQREPQTFYAY